MDGSWTAWIALIGFEQVAMSLFGEWETWQFAGYSGEALSWEGFIGVCWAFAGVVLILVRLYISVAIYSFFFNIDPNISPNEAPESLDPYFDKASFSSLISISLIERFKVLVF